MNEVTKMFVIYQKPTGAIIEEGREHCSYTVLVKEHTQLYFQPQIKIKIFMTTHVQKKITDWKVIFVVIIGFMPWISSFCCRCSFIHCYIIQLYVCLFYN